MTEKDTYKIPEEFVNLFIKDYEKYPTIIETDFYVLDGLKVVIGDGEIISTYRQFTNNNHIYKNGLIKFETGYVFFTKRNNEMTYKLFFLVNENSVDSIMFYINKLKNFKTIS
jgi:hypothetical protein